MALRLPRLPRGARIAEANGAVGLEFQNWWQSVVKAIEAQEAAQDAIIADLQAVQADLADQLAAIIAAQAAADAAQAAATDANDRALGIQAAASLTFDAADPALKSIFDAAAPPP